MKVNNHTNLFGRRDLLRLGSLGSLGITLDKVLRAGTSKDISCILVWQSGGSSHLDTLQIKQAPMIGSSVCVSTTWR